jgi:3-oxoacyl-[acyl-carrier-protein] synthase II
VSARPLVAVTGIGWEIPGVDQLTDLLAADHEELQPAKFVPEAKLGRRGLRYKDRTTLLSLCAASVALADAGLGLRREDCLDGASTGVVVSSNLGNLDTVCRVVDQIRQGGVDATSPMDLPNASSNIISSNIAIWFGFTGLNLMVCNGFSSGLDAMHIAANAIRAGRTRRMVVVGAETSNAVVGRLMAESASVADRCPQPRLFDGAAALVLESERAAMDRGARVLGTVGRFATGVDMRTSLLGLGLDPMTFTERGVGLLLSSAADCANLSRYAWDDESPLPIDTEHRDVEALLGCCYGALGVIEVAAAIQWLARRSTDAALVCTPARWSDHAATLLVQGPEHAGRHARPVAEVTL